MITIKNVKKDAAISAYTLASSSSNSKEKSNLDKLPYSSVYLLQNDMFKYTYFDIPHI